MLKISFANNGYTYFGDDLGYKNNKEYAFNPEIFQNYVTKGDYENAVEYASKYHFNDPRKQEKADSYLNDLRRNGRILKAIYSRIQDPDELANVQFADRVFEDRGLEQEDQDNNYVAATFKRLKDSLGSTPTTWFVNGYRLGEVNKNDAVKLQTTFQPKVRRAFEIKNPTNFFDRAVNWIGDNLVADNPNSIDEFYKKSGFDKKTLQDAGIDVFDNVKDGTTTITYDKSNPLANKIIYVADSMNGSLIHSGPGSAAGLLGNQVTFTGLDNKGHKLYTSNATGQIADLIDKAKSIKEQAFKANDLAQKEYSSTIGGFIDDDIERLNSQLQNGTITPTQYSQLYKNTAGGNIISMLKSAGTADMNMYITEGALDDDKENSERLIQADNEQRHRIWASYMAAAKPNEIHLNAMVSNGKIGTLVTIDPPTPTDKELEDGKVKPTDASFSKNHRRVQIFVPGLFQQEAQEKINRDTNARASQEINAMQDYGYEYKTRDGHRLRAVNVTNEQGNPITTFSVDGKIGANMTDVQKMINKDFMITDADNQLKYNYITNDNHLDYKNYETSARRFAISAANELNPGIPLIKTDGTPLTIEDIFNNYSNFAGDKNNYTPSQKLSNTINFETYDKISDIMDIYNQLMNGVNFYNQNNR